MLFNRKLLLNPSLLINISRTIKLTNNNSIFIPISSFFKSKLILNKSSTSNNYCLPIKNSETFKNLSYGLTGNQKLCPYYYHSLKNQFIKFNINNDLDNKSKLLSRLGKMKNLWDKYGYISIFTYFTIYLATFFSFWVLAINNILNATKLTKLISILRLDNHINSSKIEQKMETPFGKLFLAWISTKIVEPFRLFSTITLTPYIFKMFKK
ncbi:uncharacterized protein ELE39_002809 [Cryptosporidium sp. chipmunk genotype I]|uniref:uncharacterized protein n=1 Tax=Cryptosporidium sp. chipmunk genotype I TaxID=1280935 RepID=UPI00351A359A|nr:hypothetical protein ELE39_002809 [Cryptosporidium sp. chipmunk genotype I]